MEPELRAKLILRINHGSNDPTPRKKQRLAVLKAFFDDASVWSDEEYDAVKGRSESISTGQEPEWTHIIGNKAAEELGDLLGVPGYPSVYWTREEWDKYRAAVRAALEKDDGPPPR